MTIRRLALAFGFLIFLTSSFSYADTTVKEYRLSNGLHILVKPDHRAPVVVSMVWYKVGSSYEPDGITGISHALEHMMFKGSKNYPAGKFDEIIAENGGQQNAFTSYDFTAYFEKMAANKLDISFKLEADRMHNLLLNADDFSKEKQVVEEERRLRIDDNPQALTMERFNAAAYISNPYHHPVIGWMGDINQLTIGDLRKWYYRWYAPNNAYLVVVGDVNPENVYKLAQKYFGNIPSQFTPETKEHAALKSLGERTLMVNVPAQIPLVLLGYNVPSYKTAKDKNDAYALEILSGILASDDTGRLGKNLVRGSQVAAQADASYELFSRLSTVFMLDGIPSQGHTADQVKEALLKQIALLKEKPVSAQELQRIKTQIIADHTYAQDSMMYQAIQLGSLASVGLPWQLTNDYVKQIEAITPEEIQKAAQKYFHNDSLTVAILRPQKTNKPVVFQPDSMGANEHVR